MKTSTTLVIAFLGLMSLLQLTRVLLGWRVIDNGVTRCRSWSAALPA